MMFNTKLKRQVREFPGDSPVVRGHNGSTTKGMGSIFGEGTKISPPRKPCGRAQKKKKINYI